MISAFVSLVQLLFCVRATARCASARFALGVAAGAARLVLLLVAGAATVATLGGRVPVALGSAWGTLIAISAIGAPVVSSSALAACWLRARGVPAAREAEARRPFGAWLPVALLDAMFVVVQLVAWGMTRAD